MRTAASGERTGAFGPLERELMRARRDEKARSLVVLNGTTMPYDNIRGADAAVLDSDRFVLMVAREDEPGTIDRLAALAGSEAVVVRRFPEDGLTLSALLASADKLAPAEHSQ